MGITVHPNPAGDVLFIGVPGGSTSTTFALFDATGRKVREGVLTNTLNQLDIQALAAATYFLHVSVMDGSKEKKWTKVVLK